MKLLEERGEDKLALPGVKTGDMASRTYKPEVRVTCIRYSPTGRSWGATTTEGLLLYSQDENSGFDPIGDVAGVTPATIRTDVANRHYDHALMCALRLNTDEMKRFVVESTPVDIGKCIFALKLLLLTMDC